MTGNDLNTGIANTTLLKDQKKGQATLAAGCAERDLARAEKVATEIG